MGMKSEIEKTDIRFGPNSQNRLVEAADASARGALAALESFYYAWHHPNADALRAVWSDSPLAQLDNPAGGILRGGDAIAGLYQKALASPANVRVTFGDVVGYYGQSHAVFAGRRRAATPLRMAPPCRWRSALPGPSGTRTAAGASIFTTAASTIPRPCVPTSRPSAADTERPADERQAPAEAGSRRRGNTWCA